jgi:hypothetical protein
MSSGEPSRQSNLFESIGSFGVECFATSRLEIECLGTGRVMLERESTATSAASGRAGFATLAFTLQASKLSSGVWIPSRAQKAVA